MKISLFFVGLMLSLNVLASRVEVEVNGMSCGMCVESITRELKSTGKAENISVSLDDKKARFTDIKEKRITDVEIKAAIKKAGYEAARIRRY